MLTKLKQNDVLVEIERGGGQRPAVLALPSLLRVAE
jgi:hypothetical protein